MRIFVTSDLFKRVWERDDGTCQHCKRKLADCAVRPKPETPCNKEMEDDDVEVCCLKCFFKT